MDYRYIDMHWLRVMDWVWAESIACFGRAEMIVAFRILWFKICFYLLSLISFHIWATNAIYMSPCHVSYLVIKTTISHVHVSKIGFG
jgi:hypothetical protein